MVTRTKIDELLELYDLPLDKLVKIAAEVTDKNFDDKVEFCSIVSAKTGKCEENCKYCAQSSHYSTKIETHPLLSVEEVKKCALEAKVNGAKRFSVVTSGKGPDKEDFYKLVEMIREINKIPGLEACASLGIVDEDQMKALKEAGMKRYHHNINTCESYHDEVCTTHSYQDRIDTIKLAKKYGIEACSGVIIGMGETRRQRVEMALELAELNPESVPVNFLHPIEGTPFEVHKGSIDSEEILRTLAVFRVALPKAVIRYGGGRTLKLSMEQQELGVKMGVNGLLVGNYLTTVGNTPQQDKELVQRAGKQVK